MKNENNVYFGLLSKKAWEQRGGIFFFFLVIILFISPFKGDMIIALVIQI